MDSQHTSRWFPLTLSAVFVAVTFIVNTTATQSPPRANAAVKTADGLTVVTFTLDPGKITVNLPDDMRAGDTISGTVVAQPKGKNEAERTKNQAELNGYVFELTTAPTPSDTSDLNVKFSVSATTKPFTFSIPKAPAGSYSPPPLIFPWIAAGDPGRVDVVWYGSSNGVGLAPGTWHGYTTNEFKLQSMGQQGRPIEVPGPFDGNSSNTTLNWSASRTSVQDFEKNTENVSGGFGLIAESPRKAIFECPSNVTGPIQLNLKEGNKETKGTYRNVGVNLTAPKTSLLKGERTTLKVEVSGLQGIKEPIPLTLESRGVITTEGGNYQSLMIQPSQVQSDGRYSTTRGITGVQTGGWTATATVVTQPFNICLQDDSVPARVVLWNTFTGDYLFSCPGCPSAGQTGAATSPGKGTVTMKGCIITLQHNAPDRRVMGTIDQCTKMGTATIETRPTRMKFTISDRNTTDNACTCGPGCK